MVMANCTKHLPAPCLWQAPGQRPKNQEKTIAAVADPGHFGAAVLFGPTVCSFMKGYPPHHTHTPMSFVSWCENPVVPAYTPVGYWPSCALPVKGRPMAARRFSLVLFVTSEVRQVMMN